LKTLFWSTKRSVFVGRSIWREQERIPLNFVGIPAAYLYNAQLACSALLFSTLDLLRSSRLVIAVVFGWVFECFGLGIGFFGGFCVWKLNLFDF
jgi:hypothetical protein